MLAKKFFWVFNFVADFYSGFEWCLCDYKFLYVYV